jgi:hypothetical protein
VVSPRERRKVTYVQAAVATWMDIFILVNGWTDGWIKDWKYISEANG